MRHITRYRFKLFRWRTLFILSSGLLLQSCMIKINHLQRPAPIQQSAPTLTLSTVDDDTVYPSTTDSPTIIWTSSTPENSIATLDHYEIALGSTPGETDILSWTNAGTSTSWSKSGLSLTLGNTYYPTVRIIDSTGAVASVLQGDGWKVVSPVTVGARYPVAPNWNDYANTSTPTNPCAGTENGYYACIHGGEKKRVPYSAAADCSGYAATDELGSFDWVCDDTGGIGNVFFYSRGLKRSKGLADLVAANAWKPNRVVITQSGTPVAASLRAAWWSNTVTPLPDNPTAGANVALSADTIYTVDHHMTVSGSYRIFGINKVGIVTLPDASVTLSASATASCFIGSNCLIDGVASKYTWVEGLFKGSSGSQTGISPGTHCAFGFSSDLSIRIRYRGPR